jgi:hypothetical protein
MDNKERINAVLIVLVLSYLLIFSIGYIIGHAIEEKDMLNLLVWWKTNADCDKCAGYNCASMNVIKDYWVNISDGS